MPEKFRKWQINTLLLLQISKVTIMFLKYHR